MPTRTRPRTRIGRSLLAGAIAGLMSFGAAAMEEITVYGKDADSVQAAEQAQRQAELKAYLESLNRQLRERLEESFKEQPAARIKLALGEYRSTG